MRAPSAHEITQLLRAWSGGDVQALEKLTPLVYQELHFTAQRYMARERPDHTLQTTALINEVYARLVDFAKVKWQERAHFFAVSARLMRRILTDFARSRKRRGVVSGLDGEEPDRIKNELAKCNVALAKFATPTH
jgi:RNA polymerase sigma factor (TIGR02999 family)